MMIIARPVLVLSVAVALFLTTTTAFAQKATTPATGSKERKALMDALRVPFEKQLGKPVIFVVTWLKVSGNFAMWEGEPKRTGGKPIDWKKTKFKEDYEQGLIDAISMALLKKTGGKWKVVEYAIGPTDYPVEYWREKHKAPKAIFRVPG
ncbi:MAG TPA: hypothetical protein PLX06_02585 [Fimbriimonadaceae bacterium]|nr:hypothetical protein [Fimbriimonadaceae bacterium]